MAVQETALALNLVRATLSLSFDEQLTISLVQPNDNTIRDPTDHNKCLFARRFRHVRLTDCPDTIGLDYQWTYTNSSQVQSALQRYGDNYCWSAANNNKAKVMLEICDSDSDDQKFVFQNGYLRHLSSENDAWCLISGAMTGQLRVKDCKSARFGTVTAVINDTEFVDLKNC